MELLASIHPISDYEAFINVGGGVASLGTSFNLKLLPPGVVNRTNVTDIFRPGGIEGVLPKFAKANVPVLHILNIKYLQKNIFYSIELLQGLAGFHVEFRVQYHLMLE